ncbi:MAG TPA: hypothetical protein DIW51_08885 [Rhodospirillaceae bacterium]|nr:hypothetical protein [Magnetovibrio sp.]HBT44325.1 hypothetical protein [Rhodospirillaceae bacterium]HCS70069.1 hypothetical protein [Rhodospirillaceae bacterium]|tara:strand:- start:923 stop:1234 length:312 start_codon:yes stop_codon:yes gene_type:complete
MTSILDHIPPLPEAAVTSTEAFLCPWCRCLHDGDDYYVDGNGVEHPDYYQCGACDLLFQIGTDEEGVDLIAYGVRTVTDIKYMAALGITEVDVYRHHFPEGED